MLKPYGRTLVDLAHQREEIVCFTGDLTRQCEIDLFQEELPERFIHAGMAEANMMSMAGAMARRGFIPFVHTFGVFATRRPLDQIINSIAYPNLPVRIVGFMPGISSPGGPSHQAIDDVALMRAVPAMTVIDLADATEIEQAVPAIVDASGPVYLRLKRGETPVIFDEDYRFTLNHAQILMDGSDVPIFASGMMVSAALAAASILVECGISTGVVNVPVIKPIDAATIRAVSERASVVVTAENHSIVGGLGTAIAEVLAEAGIGVPLRRVGIGDTFAEPGTRPFLFKKYHLSTADIIGSVWHTLGKEGSPPETTDVVEETSGCSSPSEEENDECRRAPDR